MIKKLFSFYLSFRANSMVRGISDCSSGEKTEEIPHSVQNDR
ncbi:hypothetical protein THEYE_A0579 [Thermodesulfovibrio yellowstonii DSM 11347]|uniref:Uncharacterized protein n=1 Tax=Thermodesulfovibrio yellowstonii (strain ATCC 51303 / DSM 11347 / YP87) TaxID=289376 RepID=B5YJK7_THEYD|nr:hypothetical protein THEYE_A0579 [Thermodesulfovibrio yellowstonii DSM 11347]